jgi:chromosome segregation ATPase
VPNPTNTEKISELQRQVATLDALLQNLRDDLKGQEDQVASIATRLQDTPHRIDLVEQRVVEGEKKVSEIVSKELPQRVALLEHRAVEVEKYVAEFVSKRWDLWKIAVSASLGAILALVVGISTAWIVRALDSRDSTIKAQVFDPQRAVEPKK